MASSPVSSDEDRIVNVPLSNIAFAKLKLLQEAIRYETGEKVSLGNILAAIVTQYLSGLEGKEEVED